MEDRIKQLEIEVERLKQRRVYQRDILFGAVHQEHIAGLIIFRGLAAKLPTNGSTEVQAYYAEDTKTLYIWNTINKAWEFEVFS
jgi:hypothetical protein